MVRTAPWRILLAALIALAATLTLSPAASAAPTVVRTSSGALVVKAYDWPLPANLKKATASSAWFKLANERCVNRRRAERWLAPVYLDSHRAYAWLTVRSTNQRC